MGHARAPFASSWPQGHVDAGLTYDLDYTGKATAMSKPIDYDSPRRTGFETDEDSAEEFTVRSTAARSHGGDLDEPEEAETLGSAGAELSDEELTAPVVPIQSDEFRCTRCFLVHHHSRRSSQAGGQDICQDCS